MVKNKRLVDDTEQPVNKRREVCFPAPDSEKQFSNELIHHDKPHTQTDTTGKFLTNKLPEKWTSGKQSTDVVPDILAAMYFDIHHVCKLRNAIKWMKTEDQLSFYREQIREAAGLIDRAVMRELLAKKKRSPIITQIYLAYQESERVSHFIRTLSWRMFAICAVAEAFRRAIERENQSVWEGLVHMIYENRFSIDTFAETRHLDWRGQFLRHGYRRIPGIQQALIPEPDLSVDHFHHYIVRDGPPRMPYYKGKQQINLGGDPLFIPQRFKHGEDPTIRNVERDGSCDICNAKQECNCRLLTMADCLVELVDYPHKGVGVRALAKFKEGDILGEYVGELQPETYNGDSVYALMHESKMVPSKPLAIISSHRYGNWTRFINHSCNASTQFVRKTIGKRTLMAVEVIRDISPFEEITVDYGSEYWKSRTCLCGEPNCISKEEAKA